MRHITSAPRPAAAAVTAMRRRSHIVAAADRRTVLQALPFLLSAGLTTLPPTVPPAAAAMPQPPSLAGAGWLPLAQFSAADTAGAAATFPEPFVMYLARFLVQYDERSATWFGASAEVLPSSWDDAQRRAALADSLGQFGTSLSFQLAPLAAGGARGTLALWDSLQSAYGSADGAASARLAQLFSLLAPSLQPTDAIAAASKRASSEAATAAAGAIAPSADQLAARLSAEPGSLLPSSIRPEWDGRSYSLPEALRQALLLSPAAAESAPSAFGEMGRAPLSAEIVIPAATYGLFALSGGFGCSLTHLTVVPLDVVKTRLQTRPGVYGGFGDALQTIRKEEGWRMLFQGAQATGAGYFMYGVSVYPGYGTYHTNCARGIPADKTPTAPQAHGPCLPTLLLLLPPSSSSHLPLPPLPPSPPAPLLQSWPSASSSTWRAPPPPSSSVCLWCSWRGPWPPSSPAS